MIVIGIDPGGTTGVAIFASDGNPKHGRIISSEQVNFDDFVDGFQHWCDVADVVVVERFTIGEHTLRKTRQTDALEIIGHVRALSLLNGYEFELSPTSAKAFATDDKLKALGWYTPGQGHSNDAKRHLMVYLLKHKLIELPR